jgi:hypothetical protein
MRLYSGGFPSKATAEERRDTALGAFCVDLSI